MDHYERLTQFRLLEWAPEGRYWRPGAIAFGGPRFRLLEAEQDPQDPQEPYDSEEARFSWDAEPKKVGPVVAPPPEPTPPTRTPLRTDATQGGQAAPSVQPSAAPEAPPPERTPLRTDVGQDTAAPAAAPPGAEQPGQGPTKKKKGPGFGQKAWNATKYLAGLISPMTTGTAVAEAPVKALGGLLGWDDKTSWIDKAQDVVSLVGIVDPSGIADVTNAIIYGARGKKTEAAISLAGAAVPFAGDLLKVFKFGKAAAKEAEVAGKVAARSKAVENVAAKADARAARKMAREGSEIERMKQTMEVKARRAAGRHARTGHKFVSGEGTLRGKAAKFDVEAERRFGQRYVRGKEQMRSKYKKGVEGVKKKIKKEIKDTVLGREEAPEAEKPEDKKPTPPAAAEPQDVPEHKPEGPLARKTIDDEKPEQPPPEDQKDQGGQKPDRPAGKPDKTPTKKPSQEPEGEGKAGGSQKTPVAGRPMVPVDEKCPPPDTKTSKWGVKSGFKRCHGQTANRKH